MGAQLYVGRSSDPDPARAAAEAAGALDRASHPALALVFATDHYPAEQLSRALAARFAGLPWLGCSAAGLIAGGELLRAGLVVGIVSSDSATVGIGASGPVSGGPREAGARCVAEALAQLPKAGPGRSRALLQLFNPLTGQADEVVRGAVREGGSALSWVGGGAGDNLRFERTAQFAGGEVFHDHAVAAAIELPGRFGVAVRHGFSPYGPPALVTRAEGPRVFELEYEPAFDCYRRTARLRGEEVDQQRFARFAAYHPLGIPQADGLHLIRDPLAMEEGALRFLAEIPDGSLLRLMQASAEELIASAREAGRAARKQCGGPLAGAVVFDCISRAILLGDRFGEELRALAEELGDPEALMGCLSVGEVGAMGAGVAQFHNKTVAALAIPR